MDDDDALLLGSFLVDEPFADGGAESDYAVYQASFSLVGDGPATMRAGTDGEQPVRIVAPLSAFDQRRAGARPLDPVRRPILPGPSADRSRADGTLYRVKYEDAEVREALLRLRDPLAAIGVVSDKVAEPESIYGLVRILVSELLHLYQYQERRQEQEARLLVNLPVCSPLIQMDDNDPGAFTYVPRICCSPVTARAYLCPQLPGRGRRHAQSQAPTRASRPVEFHHAGHR